MSPFGLRFVMCEDCSGEIGWFVSMFDVPSLFCLIVILCYSCRVSVIAHTYIHRIERLHIEKMFRYIPIFLS